MITIVAAWVTWRAHQAGKELQALVKEEREQSIEHRLAFDLGRLITFLGTLDGTSIGQRQARIGRGGVTTEAEIGPDEVQVMLDTLDPAYRGVRHLGLRKSGGLIALCTMVPPKFPKVSFPTTSEIEAQFEAARAEILVEIRRRSKDLKDSQDERDEQDALQRSAD